MNSNAIAMLVLNGPATDEIVARYLEDICRAGYGSICIHPREGMDVPYLSNAFWERVDHIVGAAQARGLRIWFYDEFPYPSGAAGGYLTSMYPEYRVRGLTFREIRQVPDAKRLTDLGDEPLLALLRGTVDAEGNWLFLADITSQAGSYFDTWGWAPWHNLHYTGGINVREERHERGFAMRWRWMCRLNEPLHENEVLLAIGLREEQVKAGWRGMPDLCRPEVTDHFLDLVYRPYAELARRHGLTGVPIFQDEVSFYSRRPWNREIECRLRERLGDRTAISLAALHHRRTPDWEEDRQAYRAACQEALETNWFKRVKGFCHSQGLIVTGHISGEESILSHREYMGDGIKQLGYFDIPGYDLISSCIADEENRCQAIGAKLVQSAAWLNNRGDIMAEVFAAHGFHFDWAKGRTEIAWLALHGCTHFVDHSTYISTLSTRKYDQPPVHNAFYPMCTAWPDFWSWQAWFSSLLKQYEFDPTTLVFFPVESFARFQAAEAAVWKGEVSLLETFFHHLSAYSADYIFLPTEWVKELRLVEGGFGFKDRLFRNFIVPPVHSLKMDAACELARLATHPGFFDFVPANCARTIFGGESEFPKACPASAIPCDETELMRSGPQWFAPFLEGRLSDVIASKPIIKSLRRSESGEDLLVLVNPYESEVEVTGKRGIPIHLRQPPLDQGRKVTRDGTGWSLRLAPRDVVTLEWELSAAQNDSPVQRGQEIEIRPTDAWIEMPGTNAVSLRIGILLMDGQEARPFSPGAVSQNWNLEIPKNPDEVLGSSYSRSPLPSTPRLEAQFSLNLKDRLNELSIILDEESLPPHCELYWDDVPLRAVVRDVFTFGNTLFPIPSASLLAGEHTISVAGRPETAAHGILENPILWGQFLVDQLTPLTLSCSEGAPIPWDEASSWGDLGIPEWTGPVTYHFHFDIPRLGTDTPWELHLGPFIGVAEISINGSELGRCCWEPRTVIIPRHALLVGQNLVTLQLYGSWNNLFSTLNPVENGLTVLPSLRVATESAR